MSKGPDPACSQSEEISGRWQCRGEQFFEARRRGGRGVRLVIGSCIDSKPIKIKFRFPHVYQSSAWRQPFPPRTSLPPSLALSFPLLLSFITFIVSTPSFAIFGIGVVGAGGAEMGGWEAIRADDSDLRPSANSFLFRLASRYPITTTSSY